MKSAMLAGALGLALAGAVFPATAAEKSNGLPTLDLVWRVEGLANPESAAMSADGTILYVSNVNGEAEEHDGNGFISKIGLDGRVIMREWVTGLDGPKGVALRGNELFVSDINQVAVIDVTSGEILRRLPVPGARFLNDIVVLPDGVVLVADSDTGKISQVHDDGVTLWLEDKLLQAINGLLHEPQGLTVTTMAGRLLSVDYSTKVITILAEGLGDGDGVAPLGGGRYLVSQWPGLLHVVMPDGSNSIILDTTAERRYLNDFLLVDGILYLPHWMPGAFSAYRVTDPS